MSLASAQAKIDRSSSLPLADKKLIKDALQELHSGVEPRVTAQDHIADPSGGATVDTQARATINTILDTLESLGFVNTA